MYTKQVKYTDFEGNERQEDLQFNLTKAELMEMQLSENGGLEKKIKAITAAQDTKEIIELFKSILINSYGKVSPDGKRFIKNQELRDEFVQSEAYSEMFMMLATDSSEAEKFINGIIPKDMRQNVTPATIAAQNN